ncbi:MAG: 4Fe-4S binding protein [Nanoarchaeota archaeon]|nr:4Fe-4S binding protein [Nanoarchaeota archaeon]MCG2718112.1 4Fe-4S binding protein [Nanoarchaeota archaeon]
MVKIDMDKCKLCGLCISFCPTKGLEIKDKKIVQKEGVKCTKCKMCENYCPDLAVEVE